MRARCTATSGASSSGSGAMAVAPRSSQKGAGIAIAGRATVHSTTVTIVKSAARRVLRSIGRILWIGSRAFRKRAAVRT